MRLLNPDTREIWIVPGVVTDPDGVGVLGQREWQFSDGPPNERSESDDFLSLEEGLLTYSGYTFHWVMPEEELGHWIIAQDGDSDEIPANAKLARVTPAEDADVVFVLEAPVTGTDGRSEWSWIRFANGILALAVFPQGDTYLAISDAGKGPFWS